MISRKLNDQEPAAGEDATIAVVAICRNEERNLPGLFANTVGWADEIVIIDSGSTDQSAEVAASAGPKVRFLIRPMSKSEGFSGQRNAGIDAASAEWLLHMDCDERLSPSLMEEIRSAISKTKLNGFRYRRLNHFLNRPMRHGGWNSWNRPQLARRGFHLFKGALHESCEVDGGEASIGQLKSVMIHLNEESFAERLKKSADYASRSANQLLSTGVQVSGSQIFVRALREFVKRYVWQRGFLDGTPGLISAMHSATAEFRARALVWDSQNKVSRQDLEAEVAATWPREDADVKASVVN